MLRKGEQKMKKYRITVNGQTYEVEVEEIGGNISQSVPVQEQTPVAKIEHPSLNHNQNLKQNLKDQVLLAKIRLLLPCQVQFCQSKRK
jgi:hypothetical protein